MRVAAVMFLGSVLLAGPAQAQIMGGGSQGIGMPGGGSIVPSQGQDQQSDLPPRTQKAPNNPVDEAQANAEQLRLQGHCDLAVPKLRPYVRRQGAEISQYNLGLCLLDLAKTAATPDAADSMRKEGAVWVLRSANAGYAKAEAAAVQIYLDGTGVDRNPIEAQKWVLLYQHNAMRRILRMPDLAQDLQDKVYASLDDAGRATAEARADSWGQTYWPAASDN
jgi:hypothetical protein